MFDLCQSKAVSAPDLAQALKSCPADGEAINPANGNTPLHSLCLNERCTLRMLHTYLDLSPGAAAVRNARGQWAMHLLVTNPSMTAEMAAVLLLHTPLATVEDARDASGSSFLHAWINFGTRLEVAALAAILEGSPSGLGIQPDARGTSALAFLAASGLCTEDLLACCLQHCSMAREGGHMWEALVALASNPHALSSGTMSLLLTHSKEPARHLLTEERANPLVGLVLNPRLAPGMLGMYLDHYSSHGTAPVRWDGALRRPRNGRKAAQESSGGTALHLMARKCPVPLHPTLVEAYVARCPEALDVLDLHRRTASYYLASRADASTALLLATVSRPPSSTSFSFFFLGSSNLLSRTAQLKAALLGVAESSSEPLPSQARDGALVETVNRTRDASSQAESCSRHTQEAPSKYKLRVNSSDSAMTAII